MHSFSAKIYKIGINPYVLLPATVLKALFIEAGKEKGAIPVHGTINNYSYKQTLVKYSGKWRLYINTPMMKGGNCALGDIIHIAIAVDKTERITPMPVKLKTALKKNKEANDVFRQLAPSMQKEIMRYINGLKTDVSIERNVEKAILFLLGKERFIGRDKP